MKPFLRTALLVESAVALALGAAMPASAHGTTERVSIGPGGVQGSGESRVPRLSADGRFVAFESQASELVPGDTNGYGDAFVRDRQMGTTHRVSLRQGGAQGDGGGGGPAISADGRFVAFSSNSTNLVPGDSNGTGDVFVRDHRAGSIQRVSMGPEGTQGNLSSSGAVISANGRLVGFLSEATNLVPGDTNSSFDEFVHDRDTGKTERASVGPRNRQGDADSFDLAISATGRFVAFSSLADNLVPGDTNGHIDVFFRDRKLGTTQRVSVDKSGAQGDGDSRFPALSADGRFVAFVSQATNLVPGGTDGQSHVFVKDRQTATIQLVSVGSGGIPGNGESTYPALSADARFVVFESVATNLVPRDTNGVNDIFIRDRQKGTTRRLSVGPGGVQGNNESVQAAISADGRVVAFTSQASNLVPGDTNDRSDVFVRVLVP